MSNNQTHFKSPCDLKLVHRVSMFVFVGKMIAVQKCSILFAYFTGGVKTVMRSDKFQPAATQSVFLCEVTNYSFNILMSPFQEVISGYL